MDKFTVRSITMSLANAGLTAGTTSTYTTTASTACTFSGKWGTPLTAQTNTATPTTDATTGLAFQPMTQNRATVLVFGVNAAGAIQMAQGSVEITDTGVTTTVGNFRNAPAFPALPDNFCPIGYCLVRTAPSAAAWTAGSSSWTASGVTTSTFVNITQLPERPQVS